jgi:Ca-activated chloride channel family protein
MRYEYFAFDPSMLHRLLDLQSLKQLFRTLVTMTAGNVQQALAILERLREQGLVPPSTDLDALREQLQQDEEIGTQPDGTLTLTPKGERALRRTALEQVFGKLRKRGAGDHPVPREGHSGERASHTRPWRFGDELSDIDFMQSYRNALRRNARTAHGDGTSLPSPDQLPLREDDLEVHETEHLASCATVLLLDISHSMILYGEDRITPAKQVALALIELITTRYPKDTIDVVLFGDEAQRITLDEVPYVQVGPFHTNTKAALQAARRILRHRKHSNKQVILITDGKPTVIVDDEGALYRNTFGLDPKIVSKTLDEAIALRKERIPITTFMIASDPYLQRFVHRLTELNRGKAYFAEPGQLGQFVLVDFVRNRRGKAR